MRLHAVAGGRDRTLGPAHLEPLLAEDRQQLGEEPDSLAVDEGQVEPVADPEPVERRRGHRQRALTVGPSVDVEHSPALGMRERAHAALRGEACELGRRGAASAEDHERNARRHA